MAAKNTTSKTTTRSAKKTTTTQKRKPAMPAVAATKDARRGGLGRGLASLIPSGPSKPSLGNSAADVVLGGGENGARARRERAESATAQNVSSAASKSSKSDVEANRHSDVNPPTSSKVREHQKKVETNPKSGSSAAVETGNIGATYQELPVDAITANPKQPRSVFEPEALQELVHSIREFGLMQPIVVRPLNDPDRPYELIMGERRLRAAKKAGLEQIPAIVRETDDDEMLRDALLENIHRVQLNPLEEAAAYQQLLEEFDVTQAELAERLGRSRPLITNMIRLLQLPVSVQRRVGAGVLSAGHARALLGLKTGADQQEALANRIVAEGMSVRATEETVTLLNSGHQAGEPKRSKRVPKELPGYVNAWANQFSDVLETKVSVQMGKKKGKIVVEFAGQEDFDRIIEILKNEREA